jgi:hypothetical protein
VACPKPRDGKCPSALSALCALACGNRERTQHLIIKLLQHSVVLRGPVRLFIDAHKSGYGQRAWHRDEDKRGRGHGLEELNHHLRQICVVLLRVAIEDGRSEPPHLLLLAALRGRLCAYSCICVVRADQGGARRASVCSHLGTVCKVSEIRTDQRGDTHYSYF